MEQPVMFFTIDGEEAAATADEIRRLLLHLGTGRSMLERRDGQHVIHVYTYRDANLVLKYFSERVQPHV